MQLDKYLIYPSISNDDGAARALKRSLDKMREQKKEYEKKYQSKNLILDTRKCRRCGKRYPVEIMWYYIKTNNSCNQNLFHCEECKNSKPDKNWRKLYE